jgi:hypothetical protein
MRVKHGPETAFEMRNAHAYKGKCSSYLSIYLSNNSFQCAHLVKLSSVVYI